jgi:hypothetical protein
MRGLPKKKNSFLRGVPPLVYRRLARRLTVAPDSQEQMQSLAEARSVEPSTEIRPPDCYLIAADLCGTISGLGRFISH